MNRSIALLSSLTIISLVACADDGQTTRSNSSNSGTQSTETENESEVDYTTLDATFDISSGDLGKLKTSNRGLGQVVLRLQKDLEGVITLCEKTAAQRTDHINALQPIAGELAALQLKSSALNDLILAKSKEHGSKTSELAAIKGDLAALKTQVAGFNGDFKKQLAAAIKKIDDEVKTKSQELKVVEKAIDAVLAALPFDSAGYVALDAKRDGLNDSIDTLSRERTQLKVAHASAAAAKKTELEVKRDAAQKLLDLKGPTLTSDIRTLSTEIRELVKSKKSVDAEIGNDKDAQALKVPELPAGCVKLLSK